LTKLPLFIDGENSKANRKHPYEVGEKTISPFGFGMNGNDWSRMHIQCASTYNLGKTFFAFFIPSHVSHIHQSNSWDFVKHYHHYKACDSKFQREGKEENMERWGSHVYFWC